jgi:hypothetical protein
LSVEMPISAPSPNSKPSCAGVDHDGGRIHAAGEFGRGIGVARDDGVGVRGAESGDVFHGLVQPIDNSDG